LCNVIGKKSHSGEAQCYIECYRDENNNNFVINNRLIEDIVRCIYKMIGYEGKKPEKNIIT
jgi:hypothetical protein